MQEDKGDEEDVLTARDSGIGTRNKVEIYIRDGDGRYRSLVAHGRTRKSYGRCQDHFIAHGVCVDCTRNTGHTVWAT